MVTIEGRIVTNAAELRPGQRIDVLMGQGEIEAEVKNVTRKPENPK
jgi:ribosomal 50S subunit-recycling heat shock protein